MQSISVLEQILGGTVTINWPVSLLKLKSTFSVTFDPDPKQSLKLNPLLAPLNVAADVHRIRHGL